jgi:hypothetical protein
MRGQLTMHKWGKSKLDPKGRNYKYIPLRVRTCSDCNRKIYGYSLPNEHVIDMQGRRPTPVQSS